MYVDINKKSLEVNMVKRNPISDMNAPQQKNADNANVRAHSLFIKIDILYFIFFYISNKTIDKIQDCYL